jgi:hypothetical protein
MRFKAPSALLFLEAHRRPAGGVLVEDGVAVINPAGDCCRHACPARITSCKYCGEPILMLHQPPEAHQRLAVVDAEPDLKRSWSSTSTVTAWLIASSGSPGRGTAGTPNTTGDLADPRRGRRSTPIGPELGDEALQDRLIAAGAPLPAA